MSNDDATRYPLPFPSLASIVPPPQALPGPIEPEPVLSASVELDGKITTLEAFDQESLDSFEIPGAQPAQLTPVLPLSQHRAGVIQEPPVSGVLTDPPADPIFESPKQSPGASAQDQPDDLGAAGSGPRADPAAAAVAPPAPPLRVVVTDPPDLLHDPETPWDPIPDLMPARETHMLSGSSGAGKTTWLGWFISQLMTADTIFDRPIQRPPFIAYIAGDRAVRDAKKKFVKAGWVNPVVWGIVESESLTLRKYIQDICNGTQSYEQHFPVLEAAISNLAERYNLPNRRLPDDSMLVIDSMATVLGIEPSGSYLKNVAGPLTLLNRWCHRAKVTVLLVHHGSKQIADKTQRYARAQDRILGSMALLGFTSTQIQLTEPELTMSPEDGVHELLVVSHGVPPIARGFCRDPTTGTFSPLSGSLPLPEKREDQSTLQAELAVAKTARTQRLVEPRPTKLAASHEGILSALRVDAADAKLSGQEGRWAQTANLRALLENLCSSAAFYKALKKLNTIGLVENKLEEGVAWVRLAPEGQKPGN